jgi:DNA-binding NtrC family response regulator
MTGLVSRSSALCAATDADALTDLGRTILDLSTQQWGRDRATVMIGRDSVMADAQYRLLQFAQTSSPILFTGETGTGKELFARAATLLSPRRDRPYLSVNCAQYQGENLAASELFGHRRGSFTGAVADHKGLFEDADEGVVFLDEVAELTPAAQAMLLRVLSEGELVRVGENRPRHVNVRVLAATARDLEALVANGTFREDLYYRLRFLRLRVPSLRERGDDWRLLLAYYLRTLQADVHASKRFSERSLEMLRRYTWPGNIRELRSIVELAVCASPDDVIEPDAFAAELRTDPPPARASAPSRVEPAAPAADSVEERYARMRVHGESFWHVVYEPFMDRELNRSQVRVIVATGLNETRGSYKRLVSLLGMDASNYLKFMDFLRHHRLKPS